MVVAQELLVVFEDYPPYEYLEDGVVKGVNIDIVREAFRRMGVTPTFETRPWKRALAELEYGDIIALSSGFKVPGRETYAIFPSEYLTMVTNVIIALSASGVKIKSLEDLRGLTIGVIREYSYGHEFDSMEGLTKVEASSNLQLLKMLLNQRMDVILGSRSGMKFMAERMGKLANIKFLYEVGSEPLYLFFSRAHGKKAEELSHDFGQAIRSMRKDGTFKLIVDNY